MRHTHTCWRTFAAVLKWAWVCVCLLPVDARRPDDGHESGGPSLVASERTRRRVLSDEAIAAVVGALATLAVLLFVVAGLLAWRRHRQFGGGVHRVLKCLDGRGPLQGTSTTTSRPSTSPRLHGNATQFNGTANGLPAVAAKVRCAFPP